MEEQGNVYMVLSEIGGRLVWNIVQPIPVGAMIESAAMLDKLAKQQVIAPIPQEAIEEEA